MKYIVITGVSTGIGRAIALELLNSGYFVIGTVRKLSDSEDLANKYPDTFKGLICDLQKKDDIKTAADDINEIVGANYLTALINNAGIATGGPLMHQDLEEIRLQFEVNFFGLIDFTQRILPLLGSEIPQKNQPGRIINISSVNGKIVYPYIGAYSASKFALEAFSDALRYELNIYGIKVIVIEPGIIKTEIWDKAEKIDLEPYENTDYYENVKDFKDAFIKLGKEGMPPEKVASIVKKSLESKNPKTRYVISDKIFSEWILPRLLPDKIFDKLIIKEVGLKKINK